jgi:arylsulfatase A-like enzyme
VTRSRLGPLCLLSAGLFPTLACGGGGAPPEQPRRPNVLLILTDDQGYGDLGVHGNPKIRTPHLDRLARQGVELEHFHVCPVCSPTRSSLLTGRYNYRTGVVDTFLGRSLMHPDEVTLAEMLQGAGYRTGIFGKWHLGDNYPLRATDQGFGESLVLKGGGIGQPSDPPGGDSYFNPLLTHNGKPTRTRGYCSDVFTAAAAAFIEQNRDRPFFAYLAFNAPHTPLQVPDSYYQPYKKMNLAPGDFPQAGYPLEGKMDPDQTARVYGMVTNIDDNVGRLLARLEELKLAEDTLVVFLTDNGPQQPRYNAGLHGLKGSVYDGGIRVPCFLRWPGRFEAGRKIDRIAAHIDLTPTLLDACGVRAPPGVKFDGVSLMPLLRGEKADWPDRNLFFQWHRGDEPELYRACAARSQRWKLVQPQGAAAGPFTGGPRFELYDMAADPFETKDVAGQHPEVGGGMKKAYEAWFKDVAGTHGFAPPRIHLGTRHEDPVILTRQDWRGPRAGWGATGLGHWEVQVAGAGDYEITLRFPPAGEGTAHFALGKAGLRKEIRKADGECVLGPVRLEAGAGKLEAWVERDGRTAGVHYVEVKRRP